MAGRGGGSGEPRVLVEERAGAVLLTLHSPPLNVLDLMLVDELHDRVREAQERAPVVVLRGRGRAFSAGVDVADHVPERVEEMLRRFHRLIRALWRGDAVPVAVVEGPALGGGLELVSACDLVLASTEATFGQPEIEVGCFPPVAAAELPGRVGLQKAAEMIYLGKPVGAEEARRLGLVNWCVEPGEVDARLDALLQELGDRSAAVLAVTRRALRRAAGTGDREAALQATEEVYRRDLVATRDMAEGIRAFMEKRRPSWENR